MDFILYSGLNYHIDNKRLFQRARLIMTINCKSCNAPINYGAEKCEYCGSTIERYIIQETQDTANTINFNLSDQLNAVIKPNTHNSTGSSIKPEVNYQNDDLTHWTAITSFIISIFILFGSLGYQKENEDNAIVGFFFLCALAYVFNHLATNNFKVKNWMTKTNIILIIVSSIIFLSKL